MEKFNPISVLGMGQCGGNITFELTLEIDPLTIISPEMTGLIKVKIGFSKVLEYIRSRNGNSSFYQGNDYYIGDTNIANESYNLGIKISEIVDFIKRNPNDDFVHFLKEKSENNPYNLVYRERDRELFNELKKKKNIQLKHLSFKRTKTDGFFADGAGGLQFISEYLADNDTELFEKIAKREEGTLIGIFSAGGGTGAGSVLSLLSKYKRKYSRYTLGLSILPGVNEGDASIRAGRFLTRYLGTDGTERFDTLLLFSNKAASTVLENYEWEENVSSYKIINEFLTRFLYYYTLINRPTTKGITKVFDPSDARANLSKPGFVGFSSLKKETKYDPVELFINAISPPFMQNNKMQGLGVYFGNDFGKYEKIRSVLYEIFNQKSFDERKTAVDRLNNLTGFYKTIKSIYFFYFISENSSDRDIQKIQASITSFFNAVTEGGKVKISVFIYSSQEVRENCLMSIAVGGVIDELYLHVQEFIYSAFFQDAKEDYLDFQEEFIALVQSCFGKMTSQSISEKESQLEKLVNKYVRYDNEQLTASELVAVKGNANFRVILEDPDFKDYLVTKEQLSKALKYLLEIARVEEDIIKTPFPIHDSGSHFQVVS